MHSLQMLAPYSPRSMRSGSAAGIAALAAPEGAGASQQVAADRHPSVEYGSLLLDKTRQFSKEFLAGRK